MTSWTFDRNEQLTNKPEEENKEKKTFNNVQELKDQFVMPIASRIFIADKLVDYNMQQQVYSSCTKHNYFLGWEDRTDDGKDRKNLHGVLKKEDLENIGLYERIMVAFKNSVFDDYKNFKFSKAVINLTKPGDVHFAHTHPGQVVCLYYANLEWKDGYYGETVFYDDKVEDIKFSSVYKPGRFLMFDGEVPHSIRPQSSIGPAYRFTISTFFEK